MQGAMCLHSWEADSPAALPTAASGGWCMQARPHNVEPCTTTAGPSFKICQCAHNLGPTTKGAFVKLPTEGHKKNVIYSKGMMYQQGMATIAPKIRAFKSIQTTSIQTHARLLHGECRQGMCLYRYGLYRFKRPYSPSVYQRRSKHKRRKKIREPFIQRHVADKNTAPGETSEWRESPGIVFVAICSCI